jgi:hypothetical protein
MDLLHRGVVEGFALVSSDSDLTPLVVRIRQEGMEAYGFGDRRAPAPFVSACSRFFQIAKPVVKPAAPAAKKAAPAAKKAAPAVKKAAPAVKKAAPAAKKAEPALKKAAAAAKKAAPAAKRAAAQPTKSANRTAPSATHAAAVATGAPRTTPPRGGPVPRLSAAELLADRELIAALRSSIAAKSDESGWARLSAVGSHLKATHGLEAGRYGYARLGDLTDATGVFESTHMRNARYIRDKRSG